MKQWLVLFAVFLSGCAAFRKTEPADAVMVSGRIEGDEADLAFKLGGRITEILVREGDAVKAGQVLARLSGEQEIARLREAEARLLGARSKVEQARLGVPTLEQRIETTKLLEEQAAQDAPSRVAQAESQLAAARAELARAEADEAQVRQDAARYAGLAEKGAVPRQLAEQYATRVKVAAAAVDASRRQVAAGEAGVAMTRAALRNPQIRAAEGETLERQKAEAHAAVRLAGTDVAAAEAAVDRARADTESLELRAPLDGVVLTRAAEPGRVVASGATVLTVVDLGSLYLRGFVPEGRIGLVKLGQRAEVFLDSAPETAIGAEVMRIDPQAMFTPENTYFKEDRVKQVVGVKLRLKGGAGSAKPGMPADARILVAGRV